MAGIIDLQAKSENKPEQLQSILERADQREHPTRGVTLYADITCKTKHGETVKVEIEAKRKATSSEVAKATEPSTGAKK